MRISRFFLLTLILLSIFYYNGGSGIITNALNTLTVNDWPFGEKKIITEIDDAAISDENDFYYANIYPLISLESAVKERLQQDNYTPLSQISPTLRQAIIATEDARFYEHSGIDITSVGRAALVNLQYGHIEEGASTITQQLAKNLFLSPERSFTRKARELLLALRLEMTYDKDELLEFYLNIIYFGSGYYGIHDAAVGYFNKLPNELSLAESAMLAGLPNAPSIYSPYEDFQAAKTRQAVVIARLKQLGYINEADAEEALNEPIWLAH